MKQLETFGERTSNSAWPEQRTLEGAGEGVTVRAIWVGFPKGLRVTLLQLEGGQGKGSGLCPQATLGEVWGFLTFSLDAQIVLLALSFFCFLFLIN